MGFELAQKGVGSSREISWLPRRSLWPTGSRPQAASGTYYWHVTTPEGRTKLGLFSIIQGVPAAN